MLIKNILALIMVLLCFTPANGQMLNMTVTAYTLSAKETGGRVKHTAIMTKPVSGWSVAVSRDHLELLGKKIYIEGLGVRKVDSLTSRKLKRTLDILVGSKADAKKIGRSKRRVVVL